MKINRQKPLIPKKTILILAIIIVSVGAVAFAYATTHNKNQSPHITKPTINYDAPTDEQKKAGAEAKRETVEATKPTGDVSYNSQQPLPMEDGKMRTDVLISSSNQDPDNGTLRIRTLIGVVTAAGTCTLTLTDTSGNQITKTSPVQTQPSTSSCAGFDIPKVELASGAWQLTVTYESDSHKGSASVKVNIR